MGKQILNGVVYGNQVPYRELTKAEYDALPNSKYTDGIMYYIRDVSSPDNFGTPHKYSTDEQIVGTWLNGEILYEKTFVYDPPLSLSYNTWVESDSVLGNGWKIIQQSCIDIYNANMGGINVTPYSTNGKVAYMNLRDNTSLLFYAILQYTKSS